MLSPEPADLAPTVVLLIDPDPASARLLAATLARWGHRVSVGDLDGLARPDKRVGLVLVDPVDPRGRGWAGLRGLRARSRVPVLAMLGGDDSFDRVLALESGADAVIGKPVQLRELRVRMQGLLLRQAEQVDAGAGALSFGRWRLDPATRRLVGPGGFSTPLSPAEFRLLRAFLERPQSVLRRDELMDLARGAGIEVLERSVDLLISRLRGKLNDDARNPSFIRTVRGVGYLFDDSLR
ncbi:response regulator transcription factor [Paucibacter sp. R3-3]|uniref:Response regulator transcription factor n=1 Tax=Roseateles agri TaxID=3098619 RepID=A0ABU5DK53_9BURK|nr:response regulator transcription factor [Paucibacter sp. R3-3]MDY0746146.1 response regulator transcription factor [Paucibacter sp. R3-3]